MLHQTYQALNQTIIDANSHFALAHESITYFQNSLNEIGYSIVRNEEGGVFIHLPTDRLVNVSMSEQYIDLIRRNLTLMMDLMARGDYIMDRVLELQSQFIQMPDHESYGDIEGNITRLKDR